jgi:hypothetical protein
MQPDPTTPALTALAAQHEPSDIYDDANPWGAPVGIGCSCGWRGEGPWLLHLAAARTPAPDIAAVQQPDERVAGLAEALRTIVGRWDRADIKWEPDRPHWHSIHRQGYDRLEDAINRARSLLAQPPAAGGAESRTEAVRRMQREGGGPVTAVMVSRTAGGAAGEEHLPECGGNIVCCSCHIFTPPAAPDGLP